MESESIQNLLDHLIIPIAATRESVGPPIIRLTLLGSLRSRIHQVDEIRYEHVFICGAVISHNSVPTQNFKMILEPIHN